MNESDFSIVEVDGEPRVHDLELGKKIGMRRPRALRQLIERHADVLRDFGPLATRCGKSRGQEFTEYFLTEEQAVFITSQSETRKAREVKVQVVKVFVAWRHGRLDAQQAASEDMPYFRKPRDQWTRRDLRDNNESIRARAQIMPPHENRWHFYNTDGNPQPPMDLPGTQYDFRFGVIDGGKKDDA